MADQLALYWPYVAAALNVLLAAVASTHAALTKRDVRAAIGWVGVILLSPMIGAIVYFIFGVNRVRRRALRLHRRRRSPARPGSGEDSIASDADVKAVAPHLKSLRQLVGQITHQPLTRGNRIACLAGGDSAFAEMLKAIDGATRAIALDTYIFDRGEMGLRFADALIAAQARGVEVRVLIDGIGILYSSRPGIHLYLRERGVRTALFMRSLLPWRVRYANMRSHRKVMVVDGRIGFTGGMNIRDGFTGDDGNGDLHFRLEGPVVAHLAEVFAQDWAFTTGEILDQEPWLAAPEPVDGRALARGVATGPDRNFEASHWTLLGALSLARERVVLATPYFLPDRPLVWALAVAARRGVQVDILLPRENNIQMVKWASRHQLDQVLGPGCRVWLSTPPFDHSKAFVVDGVWSFFGSSNWDPRSLRLNFEFDVEAYDPDLAATIEAGLEERLSTATRITLDHLRRRPLPARIRDAAAWLFSPYL